MLEDRFPETAETGPEILAAYTAAGLHDPAVDYWHRAGQRASERSADLEAIEHLTQGVELARKLRDPVQSAQQELKLLVALGEPLVAAKGSRVLPRRRPRTPGHWSYADRSAKRPICFLRCGGCGTSI